MSALQKYHAHVETNDDIEQHEVYLAAEVEAVLVDAKDLARALLKIKEMGLVTGLEPFVKQATRLLARLEETP